MLRVERSVAHHATADRNTSASFGSGRRVALNCFYNGATMNGAAMYSKTRLGADQAAAISLSRRGKLILFSVIGALVAAGVAVGVWSAVTGDQWNASSNGCVNLTVAGSMGGEVFHNCGQQAVAFCRGAYAGPVDGSVNLARLAQQQCQLAGLTSAKVNAG